MDPDETRTSWELTLRSLDGRLSEIGMTSEEGTWTVEVDDALLEDALALLAGISREALEAYGQL